MEAQLTKNFIKAAIEAETESAKTNWGPTYASEHEAWAVLLEEWEEAYEEVQTLRGCHEALWHAIRKGEPERSKGSLAYVLEHAQNLATEAVQIAAVAQKYLDTLEAQ